MPASPLIGQKHADEWGTRLSAIKMHRECAVESQHSHDTDDDRGPFCAGEIWVAGFDRAELDPPTDDHERNRKAEEPQTGGAHEAEEGDEPQGEKGQECPGHDLQVAGVAAGLADLA